MEKGEKLSIRDKWTVAFSFFAIVWPLTIARLALFQKSNSVFIADYFETLGEYILTALVGILISCKIFRMKSKAFQIYVGLALGAIFEILYRLFILKK